MALRGTLEHLGLAAVLQLIGQNARHGVLTIEHGEEQMNLFFSGGLLVRADGTGESKEERVWDRLVAAQLLPAPMLTTARAEGLRGAQLHDALAAQGALPPGTWHRYGLVHSTEAVYRAIGWASGTYAFLPAKIAPQASHTGLKTEHLLMEGLAAQDLWPTLRARVPNLHTVFEVCRSLEDYLVTESMQAQTTLKDDFADGFGFEDLGGEGGSQATSATSPLGHNDRLIYGLVDGQRDAQAIVDLSGLTGFDAIRALVALLNAQLLAPTTREAAAAPGRGTLVMAQAPAGLSWRLAHLAPIARQATLVVVGLVCLWRPGWANPPGPEAADTAFVAQTVPRFTWQNRAPVLMDELELVRARTGSYPKVLPPGAARGDAAPLYAPRGAGYRLRRPLVPTAVH